MSDKLRKTVDTLVYAPVGFLLTAVEDLPDMAAKGRDRLELQLRNAHVIGQFAVAHGQRRLKEYLDRPEPAPRPAPTEEAPPAPRAAPPPAAPAAVDAAIPDYDTLSASQVVRRLDGLGSADLEAVYRHEAASRGRRTILHRAQQLLGDP